MERKTGIRWLAVMGLVVVLALVTACGGGVSEEEYNAAKQQLTAKDQELSLVVAALSKRIDDKFTTFEKGVPLWDIQPGTASRMAELTGSFNLMWFAAQAGNWEFAGFEVYRAGEQVKGILVTRPGRTEDLNKWTPALKTLEAAVKAKNKASFEKAYDDAIAGCNTCHKESKGGGFEIKAIKITRPTTPLYPSIDFKGQ